MNSTDGDLLIMSGKCEECGCVCTRCRRHTKVEKRHSDVHLHAEIEHLRQSLKEKDSHIVKMETQFLKEADKFPNGELASMKEEVRMWQDKFSRLFEAHSRVQKVNQNLEDKLLKIVDKCETEKGAFTKDIATLSHRLADANLTIHRLSADNIKYKDDVTLATQLLQCKPSNFVGQKYDSLPSEVQARVKNYVSQKRRSTDIPPVDVKSITVPISTFPPTAMVYNISKPSIEKHSDDESDDNRPPIDIVSAAVMAKVLEDRERERIFAKHCDTCVCHKTILMVDSECQTTQLYNSEDNKFTKPSVNQINGHTPICQTSTQQGMNLDAGSKTPQIPLERQSNRPIVCKPQNSKTSRRVDGPNDVRSALIPRRSGNLTNINSLNNETNANPVDIINDRIWKNSWITENQKLGNPIRTADIPNRPNTSEFQLDLINERVWTNVNSNNNINENRATLIEVTNGVSRQSLDIAASPSFSCDSAAISSSEPSSSSSELVHSMNKKQRSSNQSSETRSSLLRVACGGSKNILLDNARSNSNYQTVVYTNSPNMRGNLNANLPNKSTTALVHNNNISKSTRSLSTSSDETTPILPNDGAQLRRVAEWVQSSVGSSEKKGLISNVDAPISSLKASCTLIDMPSEEARIEKQVVKHENTIVSFNSNVEGDKIAESQIYNEKLEEHIAPVKDLISFDSTTEDEGEPEIKIVKNPEEKNDEGYDVKVTKEMQETYLKLAASIDPISLRLSSHDSTDLTIEKYRKDHKKSQP